MHQTVLSFTTRMSLFIFRITLKKFHLRNLPHYFVFITIFNLSFLFGCQSEDPQVQVGQFVDSPVQGLTYATATRSGTTDTSGQFEYEDGEMITFSVGALTLPETQAKERITPLDIFNTTLVTNTQVTNLSRLLQSIDTNQNPTDGITLDANALAATEGMSIDFSSATFAQDIQPIINAMGTDAELISSTYAVNHLRSSLPYTSTDLNGSWLVQLIQTPKQGTLNPDDFRLIFEQSSLKEAGVTSIFRIFSDPETDETTALYDLTLQTEGNERGIITESESTYDFAYLGASKDVAMGILSVDNKQSLTFSVKSLLEFHLDQLAGHWKSFALQTPNNGNADPTEYGYTHDNVVIDEMGILTRQTLATHSYQIQMLQSYALSLVQNSSRMTLIQGNNQDYAVNTEFTVMLHPSAHDTNNQFEILLKQASQYDQSDLTGSWFGGSISTPVHLRNSAAFFAQEAIRLDIDPNGNVSGLDLQSQTLIDMHRLNISISPDGVFSFQPNITDPIYWAMDESKTVMVILTLESDNAQTLTVLLKQAISAE